jgi:hypothetical protein
MAIAKLPVNEILKKLVRSGKRMRPTGTFFDYLFRSYSSLKMTGLKMKCKNLSGFMFLAFYDF